MKVEDRGYPLGRFIGPLLQRAQEDELAIGAVRPNQWKWSLLQFKGDVLAWLKKLQWIETAGQVTFVEMAMDLEAHSRRPIPPAPGAQFVTGRPLPLAE